LSAKSCLLIQEPHWRLADSSSFPPISRQSRSWLAESGSLTLRLRKEVGENLTVRVLREGRYPPFYGESQNLHLASRWSAWVREVVLCIDQVPRILARTVIPPAALRGPHAGLARLGNRPLGEVLFSRPGLQRRRLEWSKIPSAIWATPAKDQFNLWDPLWGRRSLYVLEDTQLLVCEFFLPALWASSTEI
jgi:chorismate--pyruvate lyase